MGSTDARLLLLAATDTCTRPAELAVEVHTVDTRSGVVLDAEIDVFRDAKAEGSVVAEVNVTPTKALSDTHVKVNVTHERIRTVFLEISGTLTYQEL